MSTKQQIFMCKVKHCLAFYGFYSEYQLAQLTARQINKVKSCGDVFHRELYEYLLSKGYEPKLPKTLYPEDAKDMSDYELNSKIKGVKTSVTKGTLPQQQLDILLAEQQKRRNKGLNQND